MFEVANASLDDYFYLLAPNRPFNESLQSLRMKIKNEVSQKTDNAYDALVLGDCHNLIGIKPNIITKKTGLSCYNFATHRRQSILSTYAMLSNYLNSCQKKPKYMIIGFISDTLSDSKERISKANLFDFKKGNLYLLGREFGIFQAVKFSVPSLKHQYFYKTLLKKPTSMLIPDKKQIANFYKQVHDNKGYYPWRAKKIQSSRSRRRRIFTVSDFAKQYLVSILQLSLDNDIKVLYSIPALPPNWYKANQKSGSVPIYEEFVKEIKKEFPSIAFIRSQKTLNRNDLYVGRNHLNGAGATLLSEFLAKELKKIADQN
ncbi:MAG: hypothetical protein GY847_24485 [Proteobacteria bacterium]|nr:hypothetical protein [Pseudomonadota bacterium]